MGIQFSRPTRALNLLRLFRLGFLEAENLNIVPQRISFLELPAEIRNQVYDEYFTCQNASRLKSTDLLGTCKTVRSEARLMRAHRTISHTVCNWQMLYDLIADTENLMTSLGGSAMSNIRLEHLTVDLRKLDPWTDVLDILKILSRWRARDVLYPREIHFKIHRDEHEWMTGYIKNMIFNGMYPCAEVIDLWDPELDAAWSRGENVYADIHDQELFNRDIEYAITAMRNWRESHRSRRLADTILLESDFDVKDYPKHPWGEPIVPREVDYSWWSPWY